MDLVQEKAVDVRDVCFIAIFNRKRMRNCISCQAKARKEDALRANACMR